MRGFRTVLRSDEKRSESEKSLLVKKCHCWSRNVTVGHDVHMADVHMADVHMADVYMYPQ